MIREATDADRDAIMSMAEKFYATTSYAAWAEFCPETTARRIGFVRDCGLLLVAEIAGRVVGMVGVIIAPSLCNDAATYASEVMWWADPDARRTGAGIALLKAVRPACEAKGVKAVQMLALHNSPEHVAALYASEGYLPTETIFTRVI